VQEPQVPERVGAAPDEVGCPGDVPRLPRHRVDHPAVRPVRTGSLCSGYEGLGMAVLSVLGGELAWVADNNPGAAKILACRLPGVPNLGDITQADWSAVEPVDVLTAGFPCQPVSLAGKGLGEADERWIWPDVARAVREIRPGLVFLENVSALVVRGLAGCVADLAAIGYVGSWCCVRASDVGAPHRRERIFILAWPTADTGNRAVPERARDTRGTPGERPPVGGLAGFRGDGPAADAYGGGFTERAECDSGTVTGIGGALRDDTVRRVPRGRAAADTERGRRAGWSPEPQRGPRRGTAAVRGGEDAAAEWGPYSPVIRRWEHATGRPAPCPTEPGRNGQRLNPVFVEWMMGIPEGWVTGVPGLSRNDQLKALGNGVVPQQATLALRHLLDRVSGRWCRTGSGTSSPTGGRDSR